jgi:hypothetical protein
MVRSVCILLVLVVVVFSNVAVAQEEGKKHKKYFQLPKDVRSEDYNHGIINIKLKAQHKNTFQNQSKLDSKTLQILNELGFENINPIIRKKRPNNFNARTGKKFKNDMTLYHSLRYNSNIPLEEAINRLNSTGLFEIVEPDYVQRMNFDPNDSIIYQQYHLEVVKAFGAWDVSQGDTSVVIAIVDSGVDIHHPDLKDNLWVNPNDPVDGVDNDANGYIDDVNGWDFAGSLSYVNDGDNNVDITKGGGHQHGLAVASVAGATTNNGIGYAGTGFNCRIMVTKHFADNQPEDALSYASNPYLGVVYAAENGAHIINCSWGSTFRSQINQDIINYVSEDLGVLVVASSGNSGLEEAHYPSDYDHVLSVSAVDRSLKKSNFTTYGKGVDITAPESAIRVLEIDEGYGFTQGTSFSSPMVAGAAGLVKSLYPEFSGIQVGEVLRVSANDTIYEVNPSSTFRNKLGKGVLDMEKALTTQLPSIRMESFKLLNDEGKSPAPGEEANFIASFKNFLWPSSNGLRVKLISKTGLLEVLNEESDLGVIMMGQVTTNDAHPFRVKIKENIPSNLKIDLTLEYDDGEYLDYQFVSIILNPTFLNIQENLISTTISENGRIGFQDTNQDEGLGFLFDDKNNLYEMGFMVGNSESQISSSVRSVDGAYDDDFYSLKRISELRPGDFSSSEVTGEFNDSNAGDSASNVKVNYRTMVWKEAPNDRYVIVEYSIKNEGDSVLNSLYAGLYADWDISKSTDGDGRNDRADWYDSLSVGYVYNLDSINQYYNGIQVLSGTSNYWAIDNNANVEGNPWGVYDDFEDSEKYQSMSSGIGRQQAGFASETGDDVSHTTAIGPIALNPGDSITVAFALHAASSLQDLKSSAQAADTMYNYTMKEAAPVISNAEICYGDSAILLASGATKYNWYAKKTGGQPIYEGDQFITDRLFADTLFYVSNAENTWESVRTPVKVILRANPTITLSGSQVLCDNDTTSLFVAEADSYLWLPDQETSRELKVMETGIYSVTVTHDSLGCISNSEEIEIIKYDSPSASFVLDKEEIDRNEDVVINLTDQSVQAAGWFWKLSDGQTSTQQNPVFTVNTIEPIEVMLTATSDDGCQDQDIQTIDVITSLDDETALSESLKFYPNPTTGQIKVELINEYSGKYEIMIFNTMGKMVKHYSFIKDGEFSHTTIDLNGLAKGMYMLHIDQKPLGRTTSKILLK